MAVVRLHIASLNQINNDGVIVPTSSVQGGPIAMLITLSGAPYRLIGFSVGMHSVNGSNTEGLTTFTDGRLKVPLHVAVPPYLATIAKGELEFLFANTNSPPIQALATHITGYAALEGVIYPGASQIYVIFNSPNTTSFVMDTHSTAALIVEELGGK